MMMRLLRADIVIFLLLLFVFFVFPLKGPRHSNSSVNGCSSASRSTGSARSSRPTGSAWCTIASGIRTDGTNEAEVTTEDEM